MFKSAIAIAGLASAAVAAEASSCPDTTTITYTSDYPYTTYSYTTETASPLPTSTGTSIVNEYNGTVTTTVQSTAYETICAATTTKELEFTSTIYTGEYTSSSLRPSTSCAATTKIVEEYPSTKTLFAGTYTLDHAYTVTTVTNTAVSTAWATSGTTTQTIHDDYCTETVTSTTATASSTETFALKCAPTNLIGTDGIPGQRIRGANDDGIASYGSGGSPAPEGSNANKDASACCQACQEDPNCAASIFTGTSYTYPSPSEPSCYLYNNNKNKASYGDEDEGSCGLGFTIFPGDKLIAQTGCGYIAENVYFEGLCEEGQTPRECEQAGVGGFV